MDPLASDTRDFTSSWMRDPTARDDDLVVATAQWRSVSRVATRHDARAARRHLVGAEDDDFVINDGHDDGGEWSEDVRFSRPMRSPLAHTRPKSASLVRPAPVAPSDSAKRPALRPQSAKPSRRTPLSTPQKLIQRPTAMQASKWTDMLQSMPQFQAPMLQRLEAETYALLQHVLQPPTASQRRRKRLPEEVRLRTRRTKQVNEPKRRSENVVAVGSGLQVARQSKAATPRAKTAATSKRNKEPDDRMETQSPLHSSRTRDVERRAVIEKTKARTKSATTRARKYNEAKTNLSEKELKKRQADAQASANVLREMGWLDDLGLRNEIEKPPQAKTRRSQKERHMKHEGDNPAPATADNVGSTADSDSRDHMRVFSEADAPLKSGVAVEDEIRDQKSPNIEIEIKQEPPDDRFIRELSSVRIATGVERPDTSCQCEPESREPETATRMEDQDTQDVRWEPSVDASAPAWSHVMPENAHDSHIQCGFGDIVSTLERPMDAKELQFVPTPLPSQDEERTSSTKCEHAVDAFTYGLKERLSASETVRKGSVPETIATVEMVACPPERGDEASPPSILRDETASPRCLEGAQEPPLAVDDYAEETFEEEGRPVEMTTTEEGWHSGREREADNNVSQRTNGRQDTTDSSAFCRDEQDLSASERHESHALKSNEEGERLQCCVVSDTADLASTATSIQRQYRAFCRRFDRDAVEGLSREVSASIQVMVDISDLQMTENIPEAVLTDAASADGKATRESAELRLDITAAPCDDVAKPLDLALAAVDGRRISDCGGEPLDPVEVLGLGCLQEADTSSPVGRPVVLHTVGIADAYESEPTDVTSGRSNRLVDQNTTESESVDQVATTDGNAICEPVFSTADDEHSTHRVDTVAEALEPSQGIMDLSLPQENAGSLLQQTQDSSVIVLEDNRREADSRRRASSLVDPLDETENRGSTGPNDDRFCSARDAGEGDCAIRESLRPHQIEEVDQPVAGQDESADQFATSSGASSSLSNVCGKLNETDAVVTVPPVPAAEQSIDTYTFPTGVPELMTEEIITGEASLAVSCSETNEQPDRSISVASTVAPSPMNPPEPQPLTSDLAETLAHPANNKAVEEKRQVEAAKCIQAAWKQHEKPQRCATDDITMEVDNEMPMQHLPPQACAETDRRSQTRELTPRHRYDPNREETVRDATSNDRGNEVHNGSDEHIEASIPQSTMETRDHETAPHQTVAAQSIQRQFRRHVYRRNVLDQLGFLVRHHRREARKKTRRLSDGLAAKLTVEHTPMATVEEALVVEAVTQHSTASAQEAVVVELETSASVNALPPPSEPESVLEQLSIVPPETTEVVLAERELENEEVGKNDGDVVTEPLGVAETEPPNHELRIEAGERLAIEDSPCDSSPMTSTPKELVTWERYIDAGANKSFYYHPTRQLSRWHRPDGDDVVVDRTDAPQDQPQASTEFHLHDHWERYKDSETNKSFYFNRTHQVSQWDRPHDAPVVDTVAEAPVIPEPATCKATVLESYGGRDRCLRPDSAEIFFQHASRNEYVDGSVAPDEFTAAKAALLDAAMDATSDRWTLRRNQSLRGDRRGEWQAFVDTESHQTFYYNTRSGESTWEKPRAFDAPVTTTDNYEWVMYVDAETSQPYYVNLTTNETKWDRPTDFQEAAHDHDVTRLPPAAESPIEDDSDAYVINIHDDADAAAWLRGLAQ